MTPAASNASTRRFSPFIGRANAVAARAAAARYRPMARKWAVAIIALAQI
jgi:hypothetical protein